MKEIRLTKGYVALVDDEDYDFLMQWKWQLNSDGYNLYASRTDYYSKKGVKMHRVIMNTPKGMEVDHVFHNGLDNRKFIEINGELKQNLRNCTHKENSKNMHCKNKIKGVYITKYGRYMAKIGVDGERIYLGCFKKKEDAIIAYNNAAIKYLGEFANINIIN
jgi:hypothetical protein